MRRNNNSKIIKIKYLYIFSMCFCFFTYYILRIFFSNESAIRNIGGRLLGLIGLIIGEIIFIYATVKVKKENKAFWSFGVLCTFFYIIGEMYWTYYAIKGVYIRNLPLNLGGTELFYMLASLTAMIGLVYIVAKNKKNIFSLKFVFDFLIVIAVLATIMWDYTLSDFFLQISKGLNKETYAAAVSGLYLLCNIPLFIGALNLLVNFRYFNNKVMHTLLSGATLFIFLDLYSILINPNEIYSINSLLDPFWVLALQLIALSALYDVENPKSGENKKYKVYFILNKLNAALPYVCIMILIVLILYKMKEINFLIIGFIITIIFVVIRQIISLIENEKLLLLLYKAYEELECKNSILNKKQQELEELSSLKEKEANTDYLTGLPNRRFLREKAKILLGECKKNNKSLSVLMIDVDNFKNINDTYGHDFGDEVLKALADTMMKTLKGQLCGRVGGEEFVCFLQAEKQEALDSANNLRKNLSKNIVKYNENTNVTITVSIGLTITIADKDESISELIIRADKALYKAKEKGKNRVELI